MKDFEKIIENLGITIKEFELYKKLYEIGPSTVMELSKITNTPRTTVHQNVEKLISKGLIFQSVSKTKRVIVAEEPKKLELIINKQLLDLEIKQKKIDETKNVLPEFIKELSLIKNYKDYPATDIRYYEGVESLRKIYDELLKSKIVRSYVDNEGIAKVFPENDQKFINAILNGVEVYDLQVRTKKAKYVQETYPKKNYYSKYLPEGLKIDLIDYLIYDDTITIVQGGMKPNAIIIKNKVIYNNAVMLYDLLWNLIPNEE